MFPSHALHWGRANSATSTFPFSSQPLQPAKEEVENSRLPLLSRLGSQTNRFLRNVRFLSVTWLRRSSAVAPRDRCVTRRRRGRFVFSVSCDVEKTVELKLGSLSTSPCSPAPNSLYSVEPVHRRCVQLCVTVRMRNQREFSETNMK